MSARRSDPLRSVESTSDGGTYVTPILDPVAHSEDSALKVARRASCVRYMVTPSQIHTEG
jgi:hypothetical protein